MYKSGRNGRKRRLIRGHKIGFRKEQKLYHFQYKFKEFGYSWDFGTQLWGLLRGKGNMQNITLVDSLNVDLVRHGTISKSTRFPKSAHPVPAVSPRTRDSVTKFRHCFDAIVRGRQAGADGRTAGVPNINQRRGIRSRPLPRGPHPPSRTLSRVRGPPYGTFARSAARIPIGT